ncbi:putative NADH-ubiquinone oxidoreductase 14.8 kDa subunit [[Candida] railenensis]|uniref:NADH-ubiquinone oxidoreductase 14.8 kDa subunit n=1 Tax=[Candida] railenensis TaxID=45579 RepID=A0A9P0QLW4_9ASCO|nr:putative NADH-ubiquinone oxidoreductase 14.8 kDa subunit [[Candida] railenensis]
MTLATEFAETTRRSASNAELRSRVLHLYRKYMRYSKEMSELYELDMPVSNVKTKIRQEFERQRFVNDLSVANVLYMKGQMEFQEIINFWKQQCHVLRYFEDQSNYNVVDKNDFIKGFLRGNNP